MSDDDFFHYHEEWLRSDEKDEIVLAAVLHHSDGAAQLMDHYRFDLDQDLRKPLKLSLPPHDQIDLSKLSLESDVDAFFDLYPECVRQDHDHEEYESDEEEGEEVTHRGNDEVMNLTDRPTKKRHSSTNASMERSFSVQFQQQQQQQQSRTNPEAHHQHLQPPHVNNRGPSWDELEGQRQRPSAQFPYAPQQQQQQQAQHPPPQMMAFQSALQFYESGGGASGNTKQNHQDVHNNNNNNQQQQRPLQQTTMNNNNPYARQQVQKPNIPDSLKRKFQPPKRSEGEANKKSSGANNSNRHNSESQQNTGHDDDLPEALKGLDKDLVEKIQNEIMESGETITFDDIAGLEDAKQTVQELVCWPMKRPDLFTGLRRGPNGLLLFGPPGTGKTLIGKAIAHESGATFFSISSSSLTSKWIGEGEKLVRTLFAVAAYREPAVVFIDEIDSLLTQRKADENEASRRIKTEFLVQLDGTGTGTGRVLCIGATNRPHELDDAARRRFVKRLYIPLPATPDREVLLRTLLGKNKNKLSSKDFQKLAVDTDGFSGADLKALCVEAAMGPLRALGPKALEIEADAVPPISAKHFRQALRGVNPSVAPADLEVYIDWDKTYGSRRSANYDEDEESDDGDNNNNNGQHQSGQA